MPKSHRKNPHFYVRKYKSRFAVCFVLKQSLYFRQVGNILLVLLPCILYFGSFEFSQLVF